MKLQLYAAKTFFCKIMNLKKNHSFFVKGIFFLQYKISTFLDLPFITFHCKNNEIYEILSFLGKKVNLLVVFFLVKIVNFCP